MGARPLNALCLRFMPALASPAAYGLTQAAPVGHDADPAVAERARARATNEGSSGRIVGSPDVKQTSSAPRFCARIHSTRSGVIAESLMYRPSRSSSMQKMQSLLHTAPIEMCTRSACRETRSTMRGSAAMVSWPLLGARSNAGRQFRLSQHERPGAKDAFRPLPLPRRHGRWGLTLPFRRETWR